MAEILCPECGKPNPDDLDTCRFCQASLKAIPDWLRDLQRSEPELPAEPSSTGEGAGSFEATSDSDLPDWLRQAATPPESEIPPASISPFDTGAQAEEPAASGELPDWLAALNAPSEAEIPPLVESPAQPAEAPVEESPDWLATLSNPAEVETPPPAEPPAEPPTPPAAAPAEENLDWLASLIGQAEPEASSSPETPAEVPAVPAEESPDWLATLSGESELETPATTEPPVDTSTASIDDTLDWLARIEPAAPPTEEPPASPFATAPEEKGFEWTAPSSEPPAASETGEPDWLAGLGEGQKPGAEAEEPPATPLEGGETPDWLATIGNVPTEKPAGAVPAFTFDEGELVETPAGDENRPLSTLPDWISQIKAEQPEEPAQEPAEPGLAPAELPGWLEAMRPIEAAAPTAPLEDLTGADVVSAGPLIGLRGVLSAEPEAGRARKPVSYSLKLRVTDDQRSRLALMEELLAAEQKPKPLPTQAAITPQHFFRLGIFLALFLPILWMVISQSLIVPLPTMESLPGMQNFYIELVKVASGAPVLLAVDYEAGFTGEMEVGAKAVVGQLARQQAYMVFMSTNTAGPALAERLLTVVAPETGKPYANAANLGYLPGGALGLVDLALSPRQSLPYSLNGTDPWVVPSLASISTLADFSLVIVMTNDAETARAWIEQTSPTLQANGVPLLLVTSAQAEPLVLPYTSGAQPQVQGMLAGLPGAVLLEHRTGIASIGSGMWDAFSVSLTIAALAILIGSVSGAVITALKEGKPELKQTPKPGRKSEPKQEQP